MFFFSIYVRLLYVYGRTHPFPTRLSSDMFNPVDQTRRGQLCEDTVRQRQREVHVLEGFIRGRGGVVIDVDAPLRGEHVSTAYGGRRLFAPPCRDLVHPRR